LNRPRLEQCAVVRIAAAECRDRHEAWRVRNAPTSNRPVRE
jgi:hypothetical protein